MPVPQTATRMPDRILRTGAEATLLGPLLMTSPRLTPCQRSATDDRARSRMLPYFPDPYLSWRRVAEAVTSELRSSCCRYISDTDPISPYLIRTRSRRIYLSYTDPISSSFHSSAACLGTRRTPGRQSRRRAVRAPSLSSAARPMPAPHRYSRVPPPQSPHSRRRRTASKAPGHPTRGHVSTQTRHVSGDQSAAEHTARKGPCAPSPGRVCGRAQRFT